MSFRPRFLNSNLRLGHPHLGPGSQGRANELSQLSASMRPTTKLRLSTSTYLPHHTPRRPGSHHHHHHHHHHQRSNRYQQQQTRHNSTNSNTSQQRIDRLISRLPRFLHPYLSSLRSSPTSFIVAFLILHEITAVVPGLGFFYLFHYAGADDERSEDDKDERSDNATGKNNDSNSDSDSGDNEVGGKGEGKVERVAGSFGRRIEKKIMSWAMEDEEYLGVMTKRMERFEKWFRRKGYFGFGDEQEQKEEDLDLDLGGAVAIGGGEDGEKRSEREKQVLMKKWQSGDEKYRVLVDAALAYVVTKALLPVRIIVSVQATPWFAGMLGRVRRVFGGALRK